MKNQMKKVLEMLSSYIVISQLDEVVKYLIGYSSHYQWGNQTNFHDAKS